MDYNATQFLADVRMVVDYNWNDEATDYEHAEQEGNSRENHIFEVLERLDDFLKGTAE